MITKKTREFFPGTPGNSPDPREPAIAQTHGALPAPPVTHLRPWRELIVVAAITVTAAALAGHFEVNERVFALTRGGERWQLDEWPIVVFVLALCLIWLSTRRYRQALVQLQARQAAETHLAQALAANRELAYQGVRTQESERRYLARELHDELGQYLNAIKVDAVSLREGVESEAAVNAAAARIVTAADHVYGVVGDLIRRLRPAGLDDLGLVAALESCVDQWRARMPSVHYAFSAAGDLEGLGELTNLTLYRLIQEGLTNSAKHAGAQQVRVSLRRESGRQDALVLAVSDDGRGASLGTLTFGFGLRGIRERVEMMGGRFEIETQPERGFRFEARLPATGGAC